MQTTKPELTATKRDWRAPWRNWCRLRAKAYTLAAEVADHLAACDGDDANAVREMGPEIRVAESAASASTYVYLDHIKSRVSDHAGDRAGEASEYLTAEAMVARWLADKRAEFNDG